MIDFLRECGISDNTIIKLEDIYNQETLYNLYCNEYEIKDIIEYFNSIGIRCIEDILVNYTGVFLDTLSDVKKMFENKNMELIVKMINEDYNFFRNL